MTGHSYRRYRGRKRTFENQDLGPFVTHELNRCITCYRCARFYNDYAGGRDFGVFGLRNQVYFGRAERRHAGERVQRQPRRGLPHRRVRRQDRSRATTRASGTCRRRRRCARTAASAARRRSSARYGELRRVQGRYNRDVNRCSSATAAASASSSSTRRSGCAWPVAAGLLPPRRRAAAVRRARRAAAWPSRRCHRRAADRGGRPRQRRRGRAPLGADGRRPEARPPSCGELALDAAAGLLRGRRAIGIGSPRASLEANYALRTLVGPEQLLPRHVRRRTTDLVGAVLEIAADPRLRLGVGGRRRTAPTPSSCSARTSPTPRRCSTSPSAPGCTCAPTWWRSATTSAAGTTPASRASSGASRAPCGSRRRTPPSSTTSPPRRGGRRPTTSCAWRWRSRTRSTPSSRRCPAWATTRPRWRGAGPRAHAPARRRWSSPAVRAAPRSSSAPRRSWPRRSSRRRARRRGGEPGAARAHRPGAGQRGAAHARRRHASSQALAALARGEARGRRRARQRPRPPRPRAARRRPAAPRACPSSRWRPLEDRLTARADVVLPAATFAEETGTWVSHEGRAQRYFAVLPPRRRRAPGLALAARAARCALGRREARGWSDARRRAGRARDGAAGVRAASRAAAPAADLAPRRPQGRPPAAALERPHRHGRRPHRLRARRRRPTRTRRSPTRWRACSRRSRRTSSAARTWWPGWNSGNGLHKFGEELEAAAAPAEPVRRPPARRRRAAAGELPAGRRRRRALRAARRRAVVLVAAAPHLRLRAAQHVHAGHRASARRRPSSASTRRTPSGSPCARATGGGLAAVDGRARAASRSCRRCVTGTAGAARGPPRPALRLAAGARAPRARGGAA